MIVNVFMKLDEIEDDLVEQYEFFKQKMMFINKRKELCREEFELMTKEAWDTTVGDVLKYIDD